MKMLEGIKVLDFTTMHPGPKAGTYFADYGAEVVKVEVPGRRGRPKVRVLCQRYIHLRLRQGPRQEVR